MTITVKDFKNMSDNIEIIQEYTNVVEQLKTILTHSVSLLDINHKKLDYTDDNYSDEDNEEFIKQLSKRYDFYHNLYLSIFNSLREKTIDLIEYNLGMPNIRPYAEEIYNTCALHIAPINQEFITYVLIKTNTYKKEIS